MIQLAPSNLCTGCGACAAQCSKKCISMKENVIGVILPSLDASSCVECHACEKVCPVINPISPYQPQKAYAAWSLNDEERRTSASGGVAAEFYKFALKSGYKVIGASQNEDFSVTHKIVSSYGDITPFKNSKYVFSDAYDVIPKVKVLLKTGEKILFIGLPCQVAALRKLNNDHPNLFLVELVCHGTTPLSYLLQHVRDVEKNMSQTAVRMSFRDHDLGTQLYFFSLYNQNGERFYAKRTKDGDTYQYGYHRAVSYRENCYNCLFARKERIADITISDYKGLGEYAPCDYTNTKVSSILINSEKGAAFVNDSIAMGYIHADERPLAEPIMGDKQLRHPSQKTTDRLEFEERIAISNGGFEAAIESIAQKGVQKINKKTSVLVKFIQKIKKIING